MAFLLKEKIFGFFGREIKIRDSYKDVNGKGILERYNEVMGLEYDTYYSEYIDNLIDNTLVPQTVLEKFIPYMELMFGGLQFSGTDIQTRRKILKFALRLYETKGTKKGYDLIFRLLGFNSVTIVEYDDNYTFDMGNTTSAPDPSTVGFDDFYRRFDSKCPTCSAYTLMVYGDMELTSDLQKMIFRADDLERPINADIRSVFYNDTLLIGDDLPSIFIDNNGDLQYSNIASPDVDFELTSDGDLTVNKTGYNIDVNGDLNFE